MGYFTGLLGGFQDRREEHAAQTFQDDQQRRQSEGKIYEYLLNSDDPEIKSLALSGLIESAQPGSKKKGLSGFMGEMQGSTVFPQIRQLMDSLVPAGSTMGGPTGSAGAPPARPGSAAMPTHAMTDPAAQPGGGQIDPEVAEMQAPGMAGPATAGPSAPPMLQGSTLAGAMGGPANPESQFKRRGTGVPTAEEIAERNAAAGITGRLRAVASTLNELGAPPEMQQRAVMGAAGAPLPNQTAQNGALMADPNDPETPIPTVRNPDGTITTADGRPITGLVGYVKPTSAGQITKVIADKNSPSGYSAVTYDPVGNETRRVPTEYNPAPAYAGTATLADANSDTGRSTVPILRGGGTGPALGPAPAPANETTAGEADATALLKDIDNAIKAAESQSSPVASLRKKQTPAPIDAIARARASAAGLPFTTYFEVQRAAQKTGTSKKSAAPAAESTADRVRRRLLGGAAQ